jgi:hypothetical protein
LRQQLSGPKTVELPVSCYGKLPMYKDFLREKMAGKDAQAYKQWLDRGISHYWGPHEVYRGETIFPHAFLLRFPGTGSYVIGYLWGSHDDGELRFFPFSLFVSLPAGREAFPPHSILELLEPVIAAGRRWHHEASQLASFQEFVSWSRALTLEVTIRPEKEVTPEILRRAEGFTVGEYTKGLWDHDADSEWPALQSYLTRHQKRVAEHRHPTDLAARFPSSSRIPMVLQAHFLTLILERFDNRRERPVQLLIPVYDDKAGITVILRSLRPEDVYAFHPDMPLNENIEDFCTTVPRRAGHEVSPTEEPERQKPLRAFLDLKFDSSTGSAAARI